MLEELFDKFHEECAVIGIINHPEASKYCYLGLYSMQHRGQEGAGIVSTDSKGMFVYKDMGLVADIFDSETLEKLDGKAAIGHTRYATFGGKDWQNLQPFVANFANDGLALAHNGNLINASELRVALENKGAIFSSTSDSEVILHLTAHAQGKDTVEKLSSALKQVKGAYSLAVMTHNKLLAARDPSGVRPLSLGKVEDSYIIASETCAFDLIGAKFIRDIAPGEILEISSDGSMRSDYSLAVAEPALCIFEYIYFARPDSTINGKNVYVVRKQLGQELAKEHPAQADMVVPVPDSGVPAAIGYAQQIGLPLELGLIRNHYVGRTFIEPSQTIRDFGVKVKLNPNTMMLQGKKIVVVDDSIVRGTTCKILIKLLREAGAAEVHFRVSSPPTVGSCYYGIDTPLPNELIASKNSVEEIKDYIGADSLGYLSTDGMYRAINGSAEHYCDACFTLKYKLGKPENDEACGCGGVSHRPRSRSKK
ncbi:MAG: amidophosphoribosyltransferase [Proteobacteria bacterium]|nr:amidophosphoribosyltransferase [Pseudomonadota bacterium]